MFEQLLTAILSIAESLKAIAAALTNNTAPAGDPPGPPPGATSAPRGRKAAAAAAAPAPAAAAPAATPAAPAAGPVDPSTLPEYAPIKAAVIELANSGAPGKAEAINILGRYKARKASEVPVDKWPELLLELQKALAIVNGTGEAGEEFA